MPMSSASSMYASITPDSLRAFSKQDDLIFFLREIGGIDYVHVPELAPTTDILDAYKKHKGSWEVYEQEVSVVDGETPNRSGDRSGYH